MPLPRLNYKLLFTHVSQRSIDMTTAAAPSRAECARRTAATRRDAPKTPARTPAAQARRHRATQAATDLQQRARSEWVAEQSRYKCGLISKSVGTTKDEHVPRSFGDRSTSMRSGSALRRQRFNRLRTRQQ